MKAFERFLVFILLVILLTFLTTALIFLFGGLPVNDYIDGGLDTLIYNPIAIACTSIVVLIVLLMGGRLMFSRSNTTAKQSFCLVKNTEIGAIQVSMATLDALTKKAVMSFQQVKDVRTIMAFVEDSLKIKVRILVMPGTNIPELTQEIQQKVKDYVEESAGVNISTVMLYVDNIYTSGTTKL